MESQRIDEEIRVAEELGVKQEAQVIWRSSQQMKPLVGVDSKIISFTNSSN